MEMSLEQQVKMFSSDNILSSYLSKMHSFQNAQVERIRARHDGNEQAVEMLKVDMLLEMGVVYVMVEMKVVKTVVEIFLVSMLVEMGLV